jgi:hypothetical protein
VDVGSFHMSLVARFMIFTASVWNILGTPSYLSNATKRGTVLPNKSHPMCMPVTVRKNDYYGLCNDTILLGLFHGVLPGNNKRAR